MQQQQHAKEAQEKCEKSGDFDEPEVPRGPALRKRNARLNIAPCPSESHLAGGRLGAIMKRCGPGPGTAFAPRGGHCGAVIDVRESSAREWLYDGRGGAPLN